MEIYLQRLLTCVLFAVAGDIYAQNGDHRLKVDANINELFRGEGFVFESIGYEYRLYAEHGHAIGFWAGGNFGSPAKPCVKHKC